MKTATLIKADSVLAENLVITYLPEHKKSDASYEELAKKFFDLDKANRQSMIFKAKLNQDMKFKLFTEVALEIPSTELLEMIISEIKLAKLDEIL